MGEQGPSRQALAACLCWWQTRVNVMCPELKSQLFPAVTPGNYLACLLPSNLLNKHLLNEEMHKFDSDNWAFSCRGDIKDQMGR